MYQSFIANNHTKQPNHCQSQFCGWHKIVELLGTPRSGARGHSRFTGARGFQKTYQAIHAQWRGTKSVPTVWVLAVVLLLAGCAIVTHHKCSASGDGKVKLIHVITANSSCEGLHTAPIEDASYGSNSTVGAAVPAASAGLLAAILPLTNFSALTSGKILDAAAAANSSVRQLQPLMQLHQHLWCSAKYSEESLTNVTSVKFSNVSMYVYAGNDIVSEALKGKGHTWEGNEVKEMLWAVRQYWKQGEAMKYLAGAKAQPADTFVVGGGSAGRHLLQEGQQQGRQQWVSQQWQQRQGRTLLAEGTIAAAEDSFGSRNLLQKQSRASQQWNQQRINNQRRRQEGRRGYGGDRRQLLQKQSLQQGPEWLDESIIEAPMDSSGSRNLLQKQSRASQQWNQQTINNQRRRQGGSGGGDRRHLLHEQGLLQAFDFLDGGFDLAVAESSGTRNLLQKQSRASQQWNQQRINNQRRRQEGGGGYGGDRRHLLHEQSPSQVVDFLDGGFDLAVVGSSGSRSLLQKQSRASKQWDQQRINNQRRRQGGSGGGDRRHLLHEHSLPQTQDPLDERFVVAPKDSFVARNLLQKQSRASQQWNQQRINNQRRRQEGGGGYGGDRRHLLHQESLQPGQDLLNGGFDLAVVGSSGSRSLLQKQSRASKQWDQQRINNQRRRQGGSGGGDRRHLLHEQSLQQAQEQLIVTPVDSGGSRDLLQKQSQTSKQWDQQRINNQRRRQGRNLLQVLGGPGKSLQASSSSSASSSRPSRPLMVDVGGNVGWFTINAAAAGARVATFEAMESNLALLRRSLCANPWLAQRVSLFGTGLGTEPGSCTIVSNQKNKGDGIVLCGRGGPEDRMKQHGYNTTTYKARGEISIKRLDTLVQEDVQVMKMDVEGFELHVLRGATNLLQRYNVWYLMLECNTDMLGMQGQMEYLKYLDEAGYSISAYGFSGPFVDPTFIKDGSIRLEAWNLYCVRKDLRQAQLALRAGVTAPKLRRP